MSQYDTKTLTKALTQPLQTFGRITVLRPLAYSNFASTGVGIIKATHHIIMLSWQYRPKCIPHHILMVSPK
jgi:hypothetical protein